MKCFICKKKITISNCFKCDLCTLSFCSRHRMYENHSCTHYKKEVLKLEGIKKSKVIKI